MTQRLRTDDRTAFPYGVYEPDYSCPAWCDRYAPDGRFSFWEYVSDNERRQSDALDLAVSGRLNMGPVVHRLQAGVLDAQSTAPVYWTGKDPGFSLIGDLNFAYSHPWQAEAWYYHRGGLEMLREANTARLP